MNYESNIGQTMPSPESMTGYGLAAAEALLRDAQKARTQNELNEATRSTIERFLTQIRTDLQDVEGDEKAYESNGALIDSAIEKLSEINDPHTNKIIATLEGLREETLVEMEN